VTTTCRRPSATGLDIHAATAAKVFNTGHRGRYTRAAQPGQGGELRHRLRARRLRAFSQNLGIPRAEAKQIIDDYFAQFPGVRNYMDEMIGFCRDQRLCARP
jgi:DNA polymerase-1